MYTFTIDKRNPDHWRVNFYLNGQIFQYWKVDINEPNIEATAQQACDHYAAWQQTHHKETSSC